jgi:cytochrome c556
MKRTRTTLVSLALAAALFSVAGALRAHEEEKDLPAGPIHDRHQLMEEIGDHAKAINDTLKKGGVEGVADNADAIAAKAKKITALFPEGSAHEKSRAKAEIWKNWAEFEKLAGALHDKAAALAATARAGSGVREAGQAMFGNCKSCHDEFRVPEE